MKRYATVAVLLLVSIGCNDEGTRVCVDCDDGPLFENLSQKWHVLNNLELAYRRRNVDRYDELVDENFTFFFSDADVGGDIPEQWGVIEDLFATSRLFDVNLDDPNYPRAKSIKMDLKDEKNITWVAITPDQFPTETWYQGNVFYEFQIDVEPDVTFIPHTGAKAQFTIRNVGTSDAPHWQLVEFRDQPAPAPPEQTLSATEVTSWGRVKALYR